MSLEWKMIEFDSSEPVWRRTFAAQVAGGVLIKSVEGGLCFAPDLEISTKCNSVGCYELRVSGFADAGEPEDPPPNAEVAEDSGVASSEDGASQEGGPVQAINEDGENKCPDCLAPLRGECLPTCKRTGPVIVGEPVEQPDLLPDKDYVWCTLNYEGAIKTALRKLEWAYIPGQPRKKIEETIDIVIKKLIQALDNGGVTYVSYQRKEPGSPQKSATK